MIGDVTTTMLWIKHKIGTLEVMESLFLGSVTCLLVPLIGMSYHMKGDLGCSPRARSTPTRIFNHGISG